MSNFINGAKWAASHQASVDSILDGSPGCDPRPVSARGSSFYNRDRWTARTLFAKMIESLQYGNTMSSDMVRDAVYAANSTSVHNPEIVVAATPDRVPMWLARASAGGNYHEAWHTEWSCRRNLSFGEVFTPLQERWAMLPEAAWVSCLGAVLTWGNIIEDIRIERLGCVKYPGAPDKMADLQDLILRMESEGREASEHRGLPTNDDMAVVMGSFRDLGLGYQTDRQLAVLEDYKTRSPAGWKLVTEGPLRPLLDASIALGPKADLDHWWLAMEVVAVLWTLGQQPQPQPQPQPQDGGEGGEGPPSPPQDGGEGESKPQPKPAFHLFKVGDRAKPKTGPYRGQVVEVTFAGLPDADGRQSLKFAVVED